MNLEPVARFELAALIALQDGTGAWTVVGAADPQAEAQLLAGELGRLLEAAVEVIVVVEPAQLAALSAASRDRPVVLLALAGAESLPLDTQRSLLTRDRSATLVMPITALAGLATRAPHFTSWIGSEVHVVEEDRFLADAAREARLSALRTHYRMSDDELVAQVLRKTAPDEPDVAEWLVLLGRDDLLVGTAR